MAENTVLNALTEKYREISAKLKTCENELQGYWTDLEALESSIRLFHPEADMGFVMPRRPYRKRHPKSNRGIFIRTALEALRESGQPMTVRELAIAVAERLSMRAKPDDIARLRRGLEVSLVARERRGDLVADREGRVKRYTLPESI